MDWYADYKDEESAPKINKMSVNNMAKNSANYYLVIDGVKSAFFPSLFIDSLSTCCLYTGDADERLEGNAPYLVQINPGEEASRDFIKKLFTQHDNDLLGFWDINPNIFIRSEYDFDTVYNHVRKFTHLQEKHENGDNKWYYFRFYDPTVLSSYLDKLSYYPNRLKTLFGVKDNQSIIDAYALRVEDDFEIFTLTDLPANTTPSKIELGEFEKKIFTDFNWEKSKKSLLLKLSRYFPDLSLYDADKWLEEARLKKIISSDRSSWAYLAGRAVATANNVNYWELWNQIKQLTNYNELNLMERILEDLEKQYDNNK